MENEQEWYATVSFEADEAERQRDFLLAMNSVQIIEVTKDEIQHWYEEDISIPHRTENRIVLHGAKERKTFENVMKTFFKDQAYQIKKDPNDESFSEWLKKVKSKRQAQA